MHAIGSSIERPSASTSAERPAPLHADPRTLVRNARHQGASEMLANDGAERMRHGEHVLVKITMDERLEPKRMRTRENPCPQVGILGLWLSRKNFSITPVNRALVRSGRTATSTSVSLFARLTRLIDEPNAERRRRERVHVSVSWRRYSRSTAFP